MFSSTFLGAAHIYVGQKGLTAWKCHFADYVWKRHICLPSGNPTCMRLHLPTTSRPWGRDVTANATHQSNYMWNRRIWRPNQMVCSMSSDDCGLSIDSLVLLELGGLHSGHILASVVNIAFDRFPRVGRNIILLHVFRVF